jgi:hypothetical protein
MAHDFKVGDIVECVDDGNGSYLQNGKHYEITAAGPTSVAVKGVTGRHYATRFKPVTAPASAYAKEFTVTFAQSGRTPDIDARLMAAWLEVPANCCKHCGPSTPLPCAYHPNG